VAAVISAAVPALGGVGGGAPAHAGYSTTIKSPKPTPTPTARHT